MSPEELSLIKDVSIIVAGIVAVSTFGSGVAEFVRQGRQRRAENLVQMRRRFLETPSHIRILDLLLANCEDVQTISLQERRNFVGFFEEIAIMVNSGLIQKNIAHYMFGFYVTLIDRCDHFWIGLERESVYWRLFNAFAVQMEAMEADAKNLPALRY